MTNLFFSVSSKPGSFGKVLYNTLFKKYDYNGLYVPVGIDSEDGFEKFFHEVKNYAKGMSVSMPFKHCAYKVGKPMELEASVPQSANTLVFTKDVAPFSALAYNTDAYGFTAACRGMLRGTKTCVIYGNGCVSRTFQTALEQQEIDFTVRTRKDSTFTPADLLINASPVGMKNIPDDVYTADIVSRYRYIFDVVVSNEDTNLIKLAKNANKECVAGVVMSKYQFVRQYQLYTNQKPDEKDVDKILKENGYV